jgi:hypothetical protein
MESIASEHGHEIIRTFLNWIVEPLPVIRSETAFEEIGAQAALRNVTFPRSRLLDNSRVSFRCRLLCQRPMDCTPNGVVV